jgi:putative ABC transport system permease protein
MRFLLQIWAIFVVAVKRLYAQKGLAASALLGLIAAISLTLSVPLYADAVYFRVLKEELAAGGPSYLNLPERSPFAFMFRYVGAWKGPVSWEDVQLIDEYYIERVPAALRLPRQMLVRYFKTDNFRLFPEDQVAYASTTDPLAWVSFGYVTDIQDKINLLEGSFPAPAVSSVDSVIDVLISEAMATKLGLQVGESYMAFVQREVEGVRQTIQLPVRISGVWQAKDPTDAFWFYTPSSLDEVFLVPEETFFGRISPYIEDEIDLVLWYMIMDGADVHASDAGPLLRRITAVQQQSSALLPGVSLDISPVKPLQRYQQASSLLTILLYAFSVPILALILTFISLVVGLSVGRQRNEIAVLRSRGATIGQVVGIAGLEALILGTLALLASIPISEAVADIMGRTSSFLNFEAQSDLRITMTTATLRFGLVAVGLTLIAQLVPTIGAARYTIVTYKQTQGRSMRAPWWQRAGLDLILLLPAGYGAYLLQQQGSIVSLGGSEALSSAEAFQNPLLFFVPALGIFALTLLFLRILPWFMSALAWAFSHFGGVGLLLAARQLSRNSGFYTAPMILLVLTLSLSAFTASLAQTLDNHLYDQFYYKIGADLTVAELGENTDVFGTGAGGPGAPEAETTTTETEAAGPQWLFLPVTEYLKVPGVQAATRVGRYDALTSFSGGRQEGDFLGIDRIDFPRVAFWRGDFSPYYLGELMNALAVDHNGVLMHRSFLREHALNIGDTVQIAANIYGQRVDMDMKVVGAFDLFPTWYPEEDGEQVPLFVGNLDYLFEQAEGEYPYHVWLKTDPGIDYENLELEMRKLDLRAAGHTAAEVAILQEQLSPERQGLFGVLSVGFGAAAILTVLGFILYALFSFRQRFIELGVLRAVGLSSGQMALFLAWELAFLILTGLLLGTALGIWASDLFIPSLQVGADVTSRFPPFLVEIAWPAIARIGILFGLLFVAALAVLTALLMRMKIFQAIKLGETV